MMEDGRWNHLAAEAIALIAPFIREELCFRTSEYQVPTGECLMGAAEDENEIFHEYRGSKIPEARELPWVDVEKTALIAVNKFPGDDVAIALDYRTCMTDPRVIGTDWATHGGIGCHWREIAPTFTEFAIRFAESTTTQNTGRQATASPSPAP